jgi:hypothetical protein
MVPPFLTLALNGTEWSASRPGRIGQEAGGHQSRSERYGEQKILAPTGTRTPTNKLKKEIWYNIVTC